MKLYSTTLYASTATFVVFLMLACGPKDSRAGVAALSLDELNRSLPTTMSISDQAVIVASGREDKTYSWYVIRLTAQDEGRLGFPYIDTESAPVVEQIRLLGKLKLSNPRPKSNVYRVTGQSNEEIKVHTVLDDNGVVAFFDIFR